MSLRSSWQRVLGVLRRDRRASKARLAEELLATLSPMTLFDAGYPAHRLVRVQRRRIRYARLRSVDVDRQGARWS